jgi:hypothetical protein
MNESHQRRMYLVDRGFQLKCVVLFMGWGVVLAAIFGLWTYQAHHQALEALARDAAERALLQRNDRQLVWALAGIGALSAAALGLVAFLMSHRIAGPAHVMDHYLSLLGEGRYPTARALRRHDELKELHARFVHVTDLLKERDARNLRAMEEAIAAMLGALPRAPELEPAMRALQHEAAVRGEALREAD